MLVLTRREGQSFRIGDDIVVTISSVSGNKVRVGIEAPREVCILREELRQTMESNRLAAQGVSGAALRDVVKSLREHGGKKE